MCVSPVIDWWSIAVVSVVRDEATYFRGEFVNFMPQLSSESWREVATVSSNNANRDYLKFKALQVVRNEL